MVVQDSEAASCKMNSLGSNHSVPSTSLSTGSQSSSVNSMQEVLDMDSCSDMTMMHPPDYSLDSTPVKKVKLKVKGLFHQFRPPPVPLFSLTFTSPLPEVTWVHLVHHQVTAKCFPQLWENSFWKFVYLLCKLGLLLVVVLWDY